MPQNRCGSVDVKEVFLHLVGEVTLEQPRKQPVAVHHGWQKPRVPRHPW